MESENQGNEDPDQNTPNQKEEEESTKVSISWKFTYVDSFLFHKFNLFQLKKRPPAALTLTCGVCSAPAPDHLHFGGKVEMTKIFISL